MDGEIEDNVTMLDDEETSCDWAVTFCVFTMWEACVAGEDDDVADMDVTTGWFKAWDCSSN